MVDFLGIGAQKAGTTWLFHHLARHPQIAFPAGKELHFWDLVWHHGDPALAGRWVDMLEPPSRRCPAGRPVRSGEITPAYAILPTATIEAIHACCPNVRLFISLRNPMERAWSAAMMDLRRDGREPGTTSDEWFLDHFRSDTSQARGDYLGCLERWWSVFPREQLLVLVHDDIRRCPAEVLGRLTRHLHVDTADLADTPAAELAEVVVPHLGHGSREGDRPPGAIPERFLATLRDLYAPAIGRLAEAIHRDLSGWLEQPGCDANDVRSRRVVHASSPAAGGMPMRPSGRVPPPQ